MGGAAVKSLNGSKKPEVYFELELYPSLKNIFDVLGLNYEECLQLFHAFVEMDKKNTGMIDLASFYKYYALKPTKFSDRVFTFLDKDASGKLEYKEFCLGIWNYCTYDVRQVARVAFSFFDVDKIGIIDMADVDALFRMVYNCEESDWDKILAVFGKEGRDDRLNITLASFQERVESDPKLLQPALELQRVMRRKTFGVNYWAKQQERRAVEFKEYDESAEDSWGGVTMVLAARKKDTESDTRPPEAAEPDPLAKYVIPEEEKYLELQQKTQLLVRREKKEFSERKVDSLKASETEDDANEHQAWMRLEEAKRVLNETHFTLTQADSRTQARTELWDAFDDVMAKVRKLTRTKEEMAVELARGPDADAKCTLYLASATGKKRFDWELLNQYGNLLHEGLNRNVLLALFAGMFDAPQGQVTWATAAVYKYARTRRMLEAAGDRARNVIREEIVDKDHQMIKKTYTEKAIAAEDDFNKMTDSLIEEYGARKSRWEILWDEEVDQNYYYYHLDSGQRLDGAASVAICEKCDAHIMDMDTRCLTCGSSRSAKNKQLYRGLDLQAR